ncbi:uncharacterized protein HRG_11565 [Hirsutella rhossiliensis]|uniref:Uncharacterized protein n=1 Tax=Hirsutella rhossiliensis TaxID=111463 RepID=A0A9P8MJC5_9HYPO|nr:uncharacterized protein HRG_11565 [Hirsutella rhossiliensis]KAH0957418.1 hypothetical protein HRG_11565 [Hirsutella rhossiliensis]
MSKNVAQKNGRHGSEARQKDSPKDGHGSHVERLADFTLCFVPFAESPHVPVELRKRGPKFLHARKLMGQSTHAFRYTKLLEQQDSRLGEYQDGPHGHVSGIQNHTYPSRYSAQSSISPGCAVLG